MKGGDVLALGVLRALAERRADFAEAALLLVCDEEWRVGPFQHVERFAGYDACLCFEAGQRAADGRRAGRSSSARRPATVQVKATGRAAALRLRARTRHQRAARPRGRGPGPRGLPRPGTAPST